MITFANVEFEYPARQGAPGFNLTVPDFSVESGEAVAVIGPSGSGKTTILQLAAGIVTPDSGSVLLEERSLPERSERDRRALRLSRIGFVFQEFRLLDYLNVEGNILLPYRLGSLTVDAEVKSRVKKLAKDMGIEKLLKRPIQRLSHGERQRVAICRALVTRPACVLADEPTGNLDPANKLQILEALLNAVSTTGAALLTVTHDHELLQSFDRVIDLGVEEGA